MLTYRPLRGVQNFYIVSLAVADLAVALLVMPFNVANYILDARWAFGVVVCHVWLTADILTCILDVTVLDVQRHTHLYGVDTESVRYRTRPLPSDSRPDRLRSAPNH